LNVFDNIKDFQKTTEEERIKAVYCLYNLLKLILIYH